MNSSTFSILAAPDQIMEDDDNDDDVPFVVSDEISGGHFVVNDQIDVGREVELALDGSGGGGGGGGGGGEECLLISSSIDAAAASTAAGSTIHTFSDLEISTTFPEDAVSGEMGPVGNYEKGKGEK